MSIWSEILEFLKRIVQYLTSINRLRVYALVGSSGTGKSFRARLLADRFRIRYILDDGILIKEQKILAGRSAKREVAYLSAVKTALYVDEAHRREVRYVLSRHKPRQILLLATSDKMILKICEHLGLPKPFRTLYIEDIASSEEIQTALDSRRHHGRHVIPLPSREVRQSAPAIIDDSIKVFSKSSFFKSERIYEKTIVRPLFSPKDPVEVPLGELRRALRRTVLAHIPEVRIPRTEITYQEGYEITVLIEPPENAAFAIDQLQHRIRVYLEKQMGIFIKRLTLTPVKPRLRT
jgi:hypothetical protein